MDTQKSPYKAARIYQNTDRVWGVGTSAVVHVVVYPVPGVDVEARAHMIAAKLNEEIEDE